METLNKKKDENEFRVDLHEQYRHEHTCSNQKYENTSRIKRDKKIWISYPSNFLLLNK